jgi:hypothetical protein
MPSRYSDIEIEALLSERKLLPPDYQTRLSLFQKRGHKERELEVEGASGNRFVLMLRQNDFNIFDFSVILGVVSKETNTVFRLRRYNGKNHEHTNRIEGDSFYGFHIHTATERYQDLGAKEEHYAEVTDRYGDLNGAISCMIKDCGFIVPPGSQTDLFEGQVL